MWNHLSKPWQECFSLAIESFKKGSIPIGAVIVNLKGEVVARGRNLIKETTCEKDEVCNHNLAHAEINALLKVKEALHPEIRSYTLYTTMEPCPACFGAIIMSNIKAFVFASRDAWAGSSQLKNHYISSKNTKIEGPILILEDIQIALQTVYELSHYGSSRVIESFATDSIKGVKLGKYLYQQDILTPLFNDHIDNNVIFDEVYQLLLRIDELVSE
jgi:tRNA(adenine34) deaminase